MPPPDRPAGRPAAQFQIDLYMSSHVRLDFGFGGPTYVLAAGNVVHALRFDLISGHERRLLFLLTYFGFDCSATSII